ncbi:MAG: helix-turn-helix transcriptional regulator [Flavobacteriales bacterium]|jgi:proteasome accessory factor C
MHNQNKILRVFQLINLLKSEPAKSLRNLSDVLNSTERTLYRYFNLLEELGFQLQRDEQNRVFILSEELKSEMAFSKDEIVFLKKLLNSVGKNVKIKDAILSKLLVHSDVQIGTRIILQVHLGKIVDTISDGMKSKRQIVLKRYHSFHSANVSDRLVEPISFTENFAQLVAFEVSSKQNKLFNIDRITSVELTRHPLRHTKMHRVSELDPFGFARKDEEFAVSLNMTMRAALLLKEEYPASAPYIKSVDNKSYYTFKATVYDLKPVARFILGLSQEINVEGSQELITYLNTQIQHIFSNKKLDNPLIRPSKRSARKLTSPKSK